MGKLLISASFLTMLCTGWLCLMEVLLRHPGFGFRISMDASIATICAATILARLLHAGSFVERWLRFSSAVLLYAGAQAFIRNARAAHFEGFVFVISLLILLDGALMLATLGRAGSQPLQPAVKP